MARSSSVLAVKIVSDAKQAQRELDRFGGSVGKMQQAVDRAKPAARAAGVGLLALAGVAGRAASDLQQAQGAVESVFGKSSAAVERFALTSASRLGVARSEYLNSASLMGSALQNAGFAAQRAATMTDKAFTRSADLAATFGGSAADAMDAINAAVSRGEFDPLEKYAISLNQTAINAELAKRGQDKLTGSALKHAKAQAALDLIYRQTNRVAGQFAREADTAAGAQQRAAAAAKDAAADLGTVLLPALAKLATKLAEAARWAQENQRTVKILAVVLGGLAVAVYAVNGALAVYRAATVVSGAATALWSNSILILRARLLAMAAAEKITAAGQWVLNAAMSANPIGLVVLAIAGLVAALVIAWKKSDTFRRIVTAAFDKVKGAASAAFGWVKKNWPLLLAILTGPIGLAVLAIVRNWDKIKAGATAVKTWVVEKFDAVVKFVRGLPARIGSAASGMWDGIKESFRSAINWIIDKWNGLSFSLPSVDTHIKGIGRIGGFTLSTPNIPRFAQGGIVNGPTLAVLGDNKRKREEIIPIEKWPELLRDLMPDLIRLHPDTIAALADALLAAAARVSRGVAAGDARRVATGVI